MFLRHTLKKHFSGEKDSVLFTSYLKAFASTCRHSYQDNFLARYAIMGKDISLYVDIFLAAPSSRVRPGKGLFPPLLCYAF